MERTNNEEKKLSKRNCNIIMKALFIKSEHYIDKISTEKSDQY